MCCLNEEWKLMRLNFQENFTFGRRTSKFAKENPQNCPPPWKERKKKNPKHLKCSLTRAKDESHKRVDSSSLFLSLSLSLCVSLSLSLSVCPPLDNHEIYHKISLNFNIQQSWTLTKLKLKIKKKREFFFFFFFYYYRVHMGSSMLYVWVLRLNAQDCQFDRGTTAAHL